MKLIAIPFVLSVAKCHALRAGDNGAYTNGFNDAVLRQLKSLQASACTCPDGFAHDPKKQTCLKTLEQDPEEICTGGEIVDGLCLMQSSPVLECPDGHLSVCKDSDQVESPCCAKAETANKVQHCREGSERDNGTCKRLVSQPVHLECPKGYHLKRGLPECIKKDIGKVTTSCLPTAKVSEDGQSCLTTVSNAFEYQCPEGYECIPHYTSLKHKKHGSPLCSACLKTQQEIPICGCEEGQEEEDGFCFNAETFHLCQARNGVPTKQAPPSKFQAAPPSKQESPDELPQAKCIKLAPVSCRCTHPQVLSCTGKDCTCTHYDVVPVQRVCNGKSDGDDNCFVDVAMKPNYQCEEGYTCDAQDLTGRCLCLRILSADPTPRCVSGRLEEGVCNDMISEPEIHGCPPGYSESCCNTSCSCTKTHLARRELKCVASATSVAGQCFFVSQPSIGCFKGNIRDEKCVEELMAPPICNKHAEGKA